MSASRYTSSPDVLFQMEESEFVLLDLKSDQCFNLDDIGGAVWKLLAEHGTIDAVVARMLREFDVDEDVLRADVFELAEKFVDAGIMIRSEVDPLVDGDVRRFEHDSAQRVRQGRERHAMTHMDVDPAADLYLDLLRDALTGVLDEDPPAFVMRWGASFVKLRVAKVPEYVAKVREYGRDVPSRGLTMIGTRRMDNLRLCVETVLRDGVPGDLMETGVWRGGATIYMRGILCAHGDAVRRVWVADSFEGLPAVDVEHYAADHYFRESVGMLAVSIDEVRGNFTRFGLLDDRVCFLKGWFCDTLPTAPVEQLAVLRLDGDYYESTMDVLTNLYPRLSPGGFVIIDDYILPPCRAALADYRAAHGIDDPIVDIDGWSVYWRKT